MKKIFFAIVLFLCIFLVAHDTFATCDNVRSSSLPYKCINYLYDCTSFGLTNTRCCDTRNECTSQSGTAQTGTSQTQTSSGGGVRPTACTNGGNGIQTALGWVPTEKSNEFIAWVLKFAIGIGGGIAFLLMVFGTITIIMAGSPDDVNRGKETIASALTGLLLIIFSVFLLNLIGVKILAIPGL
jgi:hypothetical protein